MSQGIVIDINASDFDAALEALKNLFEFEPSALMSAIGTIGELQTRRRIESEKTAPSGAAWQPNLKGSSILKETGRNLLFSIANRADDSSAEWGSSWDLAHVHQYGATITPKNAKALAIPAGAFGGKGGMRMAKSVTIPARPFVGMSDDNAAEILAVVSDHFGLIPQ